jgi:hypothetical protein
MAGIFTDLINNRGDFFAVLNRARQDVARLLGRRRNDSTLQSVQKQLEAIEQWTSGGRTPTLTERKSLDMALRMFREFEMTADDDVRAFRRLVSGLHSYFEFWPDDKTASDPANDDYLDDEDLQ